VIHPNRDFFSVSLMAHHNPWKTTTTIPDMMLKTAFMTTTGRSSSTQELETLNNGNDTIPVGTNNNGSIFGSRGSGGGGRRGGGGSCGGGPGGGGPSSGGPYRNNDNNFFGHEGYYNTLKFEIQSLDGKKLHGVVPDRKTNTRW